MDSKLYVMALVSVLAVLAFGLVAAEDQDSDAAGSTTLNWTVGQTVDVGLGYGSTWTGDAPSGVTLSKSTNPNNGMDIIVASGTPSKAGTYTVTLYDSDGVVSRTVNIVVSSAGSISYTSPSAVDALTGSKVSYKPTVNVTGASFSSTTVTGKTNASWLSLSSGTLSGTAPSVTAKTTYYYSIKATSQGGQTAVQTVSFDVYPVAQISSSVKTTYSLTQNTAMTAIDLSGNVDMTFGKSGDLPAGLTLSGSKISGTPTEFGTFSITLKGYTVAGPAQIATKKVTFNVAEQTMSITSTAPDGIYYAGKNYTYSPTVNLSAGCTWSLKDNPSWLVLSNGVITGTVPTDATQGTITYTLTATSAGNQVKSQTCTFDVEPVQAFTSVPTASCVVIPVYNYDDNGDFSIAAAIGSFIASIGSFFDVQSFDADSSITLDWTIGQTVDVGLGYGSTWTGEVPPGVTLSKSANPNNGMDAVVANGSPTVAGTYVIKIFDSDNELTRTVTINVSAGSGSSDTPSSGDQDPQGDGSGSGDSQPSGGDSDKVPTSSSDDAAIYQSKDTRTFRFVWTGEDAKYVEWDFGDGSEKVRGFDVRHTYKDNGTYTYVCTGYNDLGESSCKGTIVVDVPLVKHLLSTYFWFIVLIVIVLIILIIALIIRHSKKVAYEAHPYSDGAPRRYNGSRYYNRSGRKQRNGSGKRNGGRKN